MLRRDDDEGMTSDGGGAVKDPARVIERDDQRMTDCTGAGVRRKDVGTKVMGMSDD
jgi:hypothetical protein